MAVSGENRVPAPPPRTTDCAVETIVCEKGLRLIPDHTYAEITALDVLLIPGGSGARREIDNPATVAWLQTIAPTCTWVTRVCTGAFLLVGAGLARNRRVTTHHDFIPALHQLDGTEVIEGVRYMVDDHGRSD